jgi:hypothetical protein
LCFQYRTAIVKNMNSTNTKPEQLPQTNTPSKAAKPRNRKIYFAFLCVFIVTIVCAVLFFAKDNSPQPTESGSKSQISIKKVDLIGAGEQYPDVHVAKGHYLVGDGAGKKIIYDGQVVGEFNDRTSTYATSMALSKNGQHYAYTKSNEKKTTLFVDGKAVKEVAENSITIWAVSDDGNKYLYSAFDGKLYMNDEVTYTSPGSLSQVQASSDLSKTLIINCTKWAPSRHYCMEHNLVINGKEIQSYKEIQNPEYLSPIADLSDDGSHYAYLKFPTTKSPADYPVELVIDGNLAGSYRTGGELTINNQGRFVFTNQEGVFVGKGQGVYEDDSDIKSYPVRSPGFNSAFMNDDGSHLLLYYHEGDANSGGGQPILQLDGNYLDFADIDRIKAAEVDGNTVYLFVSKLED